MIDAFFLIRHFCYFSLRLNSKNWSQTFAAVHWKKLSNGSHVIVKKNNLSKSKSIWFVLYALFCLLLLFFSGVFCFFFQRKHTCVITYIPAVWKEQKLVCFKEKYYFKKWTKHRFRYFISTLWLYLGYTVSKISPLIVLLSLLSLPCCQPCIKEGRVATHLLDPNFWRILGIFFLNFRKNSQIRDNLNQKFRSSRRICDSKKYLVNNIKASIKDII